MNKEIDEGLDREEEKMEIRWGRMNKSIMKLAEVLAHHDVDFSINLWEETPISNGENTNVCSKVIEIYPLDLQHNVGDRLYIGITEYGHLWFKVEVKKK